MCPSSRDLSHQLEANLASRIATGQPSLLPDYEQAFSCCLHLQIIYGPDWHLLPHCRREEQEESGRSMHPKAGPEADSLPHLASSIGQYIFTKPAVRHGQARQTRLHNMHDLAPVHHLLISSHCACLLV